MEISLQLPPATDVDALASRLQPAVPTGRLPLADVPTALAAIDHPEWAARIAPQGSGADIWQTCTAAGGAVGLREFASWSCLERRCDAALAFVGRRYAGAVLRERQGAKLRCVIRRRLSLDLTLGLHIDTDTNPPGPLYLIDQNSFEIPSKDHTLAGLFGAIEEAKAKLCVEDYSVAQTSLEQIFNFFAQAQEEETGPAAGIVKKESAAAPVMAVVGDGNE